MSLGGGGLQESVELNAWGGVGGGDQWIPMPLHLVCFCGVMINGDISHQHKSGGSLSSSPHRIFHVATLSLHLSTLSCHHQPPNNYRHNHHPHCPLSYSVTQTITAAVHVLLSNKVPVFILSIRTLKINKLNSPLQIQCTVPKRTGRSPFSWWGWSR